MSRGRLNFTKLDTSEFVHSDWDVARVAVLRFLKTCDLAKQTYSAFCKFPNYESGSDNAMERGMREAVMISLDSLDQTVRSFGMDENSGFQDNSPLFEDSNHEIVGSHLMLIDDDGLTYNFAEETECPKDPSPGHISGAADSEQVESEIATEGSESVGFHTELNVTNDSGSPAQQNLANDKDSAAQLHDDSDKENNESLVISPNHSLAEKSKGVKEKSAKQK
ncbi:uncharacterized protein LOC127749936 isoform X2 [Frankliniella occidentalis]|uniref:Uncharacterized protein LOC127749936 isoform X2 n=1 Tax=Frankliniella occidentalis TaxID=133901 RepID=A0A9C6UA51_FRAOC|nr:uncharacterized protein LOC127749936 isoform X2 [Frankliniella occidentalis]